MGTDGDGNGTSSGVSCDESVGVKDCSGEKSNPATDSRCPTGGEMVPKEERGAMALPKPWKQKKKISQSSRGGLDEIEIFEGKGIVREPSLLEITPPENGYLKVICKDDCEFVVPFKVVEWFRCVDVILHSDAMFKENVESIIRFPDIPAEIMEYVLRFVFMDHLNKLKAAKYWGANSPRLVFQFEVDPRQVMDLVYVAHYLGIEDLLNVTTTMIARHLPDVPDVSSMPVDLAWCVAEQFTAQELFDAEKREDFRSLHLGTDVLWEKHCNKFLKEDIIKPTASLECPPSYETWGLFEGPPPTSWKSSFMSLDLQQLADRQDGSANDLFFSEVECKGKWACNHTVRPMFYEWVLRAPGSLPFFSYMAHFPNLLSLHLVKLPLGMSLPDGSIPCLSIGEILQCHPLLQILDLSETGFTAEAAILLSRNLPTHPRLQVLRLAYNNIGMEGFTAVAQALPYVRSLRLLDVRENKIPSAITEDAVAGVRASAVEELLLEGNLLAWRGAYSVADDPNKPIAYEVDDLQVMHLRETYLQQAQAAASVRLVAPTLSCIPPSLRKLQLARCTLVDTDIGILVEALGQSQNIIQKLDLSDNAISEGAVLIFTWVQHNESLLELNLSSNKITGSCSDALLLALQSGTKLRKLSLKGNFSYGEERLLEIINAGAKRGGNLLSAYSQRFVLDLRSTGMSTSTRGRVLRRSAEWADQLLLLL